MLNSTPTQLHTKRFAVTATLAGFVSAAAVGAAAFLLLHVLGRL